MRGYIRWRGKTTSQGKPIRNQGAWELQVFIGRDPETGRKRYRTETVRGTKTEAEERLRQLLNDEPGTAGAGSITVEAYLQRWLRNFADTQLRPRAAQAYRQKLESYVIPQVGDMLLRKLTGADVLNMRAFLLRSGRKDGGPLSARSVHSAEAVLHSALEHAVMTNLLPRNACERLPPLRVSKPDLDTIHTASELELILMYAEGTRMEPAFRLCAWTGLRRGEALALRWSDVDLLGASLHVSRSMAHMAGRGVFVQGTKTGNTRGVALRPKEALMLADLKQREYLMMSMLGIPWDERRLVFCAIDGSPINPTTLSQAWHKIAKRAGRPKLRLHDLRHAHATILASGGVHVRVVQERLGHSDAATTARIYTHLWPSAQAEALKGLGNDDA